VERFQQRPKPAGGGIFLYLNAYQLVAPGFDFPFLFSGGFCYCKAPGFKNYCRAFCADKNYTKVEERIRKYLWRHQSKDIQPIHPFLAKTTWDVRLEAFVSGEVLRISLLEVHLVDYPIYSPQLIFLHLPFRCGGKLVLADVGMSSWIKGGLSIITCTASAGLQAVDRMKRSTALELKTRA
jgi:hypothetical protein